MPRGPPHPPSSLLLRFPTHSRCHERLHWPEMQEPVFKLLPLPGWAIQLGVRGRKTPAPSP